jgi:hypothetical protein
MSALPKLLSNAVSLRNAPLPPRRPTAPGFDLSALTRGEVSPLDLSSGVAPAQGGGFRIPGTGYDVTPGGDVIGVGGRDSYRIPGTGYDILPSGDVTGTAGGAPPPSLTPLTAAGLPDGLIQYGAGGNAQGGRNAPIFSTALLSKMFGA